MSYHGLPERSQFTAKRDLLGRSARGYEHDLAGRDGKASRVPRSTAPRLRARRRGGGRQRPSSRRQGLSIRSIRRSWADGDAPTRLENERGSGPCSSPHGCDASARVRHRPARHSDAARPPLDSLHMALHQCNFFNFAVDSIQPDTLVRSLDEMIVQGG